MKLSIVFLVFILIFSCKNTSNSIYNLDYDFSLLQGKWYISKNDVNYRVYDFSINDENLIISPQKLPFVNSTNEFKGGIVDAVPTGLDDYFVNKFKFIHKTNINDSLVLYIGLQESKTNGTLYVINGSKVDSFTISRLKN